jgi:hypothetical protein
MACSGAGSGATGLLAPYVRQVYRVCIGYVTGPFTLVEL